MDTAVFDADRYKTTTRDQWQNAAEAWHRWGPIIEPVARRRHRGDARPRRRAARICRSRRRRRRRRADPHRGPAGRRLRIGPGDRHLTGDPRLRAKHEADAAGLTQVTHAESSTAKPSTCRPASFDAVDLPGRADLLPRPAGGAGRHAPSAAARRSCRCRRLHDTRPQRVLLDPRLASSASRAQLPPPLPGQPGPFSLGAPGVIEAAFESAGFTDVVTTTLVPSPLRLASAAECVRFERESFGALHQMLASLDPAERDDTWARDRSCPVRLRRRPGRLRRTVRDARRRRHERSPIMTVVRVAAVQASPVFLDRDATIDRVGELTAKAVVDGAHSCCSPRRSCPATRTGCGAPPLERRRVVRASRRPGRDRPRSGDRASR